MPEDFVKAAQTGEVLPGKMKVVELGSENILLVNVNGTVHAIDDTCSHAYASLSEGELEGSELECPLHGAMFDLTTGQPQTPPAEEPITVYQVKVDGDDILVGPPAS